jgi:pimeloyl-ACP methyl ester carboxylesterase
MMPMLITVAALALVQAPVATPTPCTVPNAHAGARCGVVRVHENRQSRTGRELELKYMLVPALDSAGNAPGAVPIVPVPGGPGGAMVWLASGWTRILGESRRHHPVLFVDPRGTGNPGPLECDLDDARGKLAGYFRDFMPMRRVRACRDSLSRLVDLTQYTTESIAADLDDVRRTLGFDKLILYGVSGGTRQALIYLKRFPAHVHAMILGGVVSHDFRLPLYYARDAEAAIDSLAVDCSADTACARAFPRFRAQFSEVLERLERRPAILVLPNPTGLADTAVITRDIFAEQIRSRLYRPDYSARIPLIVARAHRGDFLPFAETVVPGFRIPSPDFIATGHYLAVTCSEDLTRVDSAAGERLSRGTFLRNYRVLQQLRACREWPVAALPADHFTPVQSNVPVLVISGAADPVTPPRFGDDVLKFLPNSRHLVFQDAAHVPFNTACAMSVVREFVDGVAPKDLDIRCVRESRRPPFVVP